MSNKSNKQTGHHWTCGLALSGYIVLCGLFIFNSLGLIGRAATPPAEENLSKAMVMSEMRRPVKPYEYRGRPGVFSQAAHEFGLSANMLSAVALQESSYRPWAVNINGRAHYPASKKEALRLITNARGKSYDLGVMQINSFWIRKFNLDPVEVLDPDTNVRLGAWILRSCIDRHGEGWSAIGAYHTGDPVSRKEQSKAYALKIRRNFEQLETARP